MARPVQATSLEIGMIIQYEPPTGPGTYAVVRQVWVRPDGLVWLDLYDIRNEDGIDVEMEAETFEVVGTWFDPDGF